MLIVNAMWTSAYNVLTIRCSCGNDFPHRADRWKVVCPYCNSRSDLDVLRSAIHPGQITINTEGGVGCQ